MANAKEIVFMMDDGSERHINCDENDYVFLSLGKTDGYPHSYVNGTYATVLGMCEILSDLIHRAKDREIGA